MHLHDSSLLTGGCSQTYDCQKYLKDCIQCPRVHGSTLKIVEKSKKQKRKLQELVDFSCVAPSNYLLDKTKELYSLKSVQKGVIPSSQGSNIKEGSDPSNFGFVFVCIYYSIYFGVKNNGEKSL